MAMAPTTLGLPASSRSGSPAQWTSSGVTTSTVPPPWYSGAPCLEHVLRADQRSGAKRRVHLVSREDHEIQVFGIVVRLDVDRTVGRELGGIDKDACAGRVGLPGQAVDGLHEAGHVRGPAHGDERHAPAVSLEQPIQIVLVETPIAGHRGAHDSRAPSPGQVVRVVLHQGRENDGILRQRIAVRQLVDRLSRVLAEDHRVGVGVGAHETRDGVVRLVVGGRADS